MIVPNARINCTGRIAGITVSMDFVGVFTNDFPMIQLWRPSSPGSSVYNNISQVELSMGISVGLPAYFYINVSTNVSMDFQSDDVIGYYQPPQPRRVIWNIQTSGYTSYSNNVNSPSTTIDINNVDNVETNRQPLIELQFGKYITIKATSNSINPTFDKTIMILMRIFYHRYLNGQYPL